MKYHVINQTFIDYAFDIQLISKIRLISSIHTIHFQVQDAQVKNQTTR